MLDKSFDPFGCLTISKLENVPSFKKDQQSQKNKIENLEDQNSKYDRGMKEQNLQETYYSTITSKTKDDITIFDPKLFRLETVGSIFSDQNIIQLQKQSQIGQKDNELFYMKLKNSQEIVNDDELLSNYLYLLKVRSLLYQPCSLQQCINNQRSEVHSFAAFEVQEMKDTKTCGDFIILFDFEKNKISLLQNTNIVEHDFKRVIGVIAAFNEDEIYLNVQADVQQNINQQNKKYKMKYKSQRDLIVNYFNLVIEVTKKEPVQFKVKRSSINLLQNDIIVPPKAVLSYKVQIKAKGVVHTADFTLGVNNILVHEWGTVSLNVPGQKANQNGADTKQTRIIIHNIIPFNHQYFYIDSNCEPNQLICKHGQETASFFFESELEASNMKEALRAIYDDRIHNDQIYIHLPDLKKINNQSLSSISSRFIKEKSKQITNKIENHKSLLALLLKARYQLDVKGERVDYDFSEDKQLNNSQNLDEQDLNEEDENAYDPEFIF